MKTVQVKDLSFQTKVMIVFIHVCRVIRVEIVSFVAKVPFQCKVLVPTKCIYISVSDM